MMKLLIVNKTKLCVCEFTEVLNEKQYNISKHLKILENTDLINREKQGRRVYYVLNEVEASLTLQSLINQIVDSNNQFSADQANFINRAKYREEGCCKKTLKLS